MPRVGVIIVEIADDIGSPQNLGPTVNTIRMIFSFLLASRILYFSSMVIMVWEV
jgi:hypothetical protein